MKMKNMNMQFEKEKREKKELEKRLENSSEENEDLKTVRHYIYKLILSSKRDFFEILLFFLITFKINSSKLLSIRK